MITRWKHSSLKTHLLGWLQGWCEIADGVVTILSLGFYSSGFEMKMSFYRAKACIDDLRKR